MRLTKSEIDKMTFNGEKPNSQDVRWCETLPAFGVRIYPTGRKTFVMRYRSAGRLRYFTIGTYGPVTLQQAKDIAKRRLADVMAGKDPQAKKEAERKTKTMADLIDIYIEAYAKPRKSSWKHDKQRLDSYVKPMIGNRPITTIKKADISAIHESVGIKQGKKGAANHVVRTLSKLFNYAIDNGYLADNATNPCQRIKLFPSESRDRFVSHEEMPRLAKAIDEEENLYARSLIWLYLFTGCRKSELMTLTWDAVNLHRNELALKKTKSGKPHYLPLNQAAIDLLQSIPKQLNNPYVFCGKLEGKHIVNIDKAWRRIREKAGLEDVWIHDLRRTVGSWLAQSGSSLHLIGTILNHSNTSTTSIYSRFSKEPIKKALDNHAMQVMAFSALDIPKSNESAENPTIH